jgi:uncharacterized protein YbjT (DUF2867 family)
VRQLDDDKRKEQEMSRIAVTGATGRLGRPLVELLDEGGHEVVPISRSQGVDVVTGEGLAEALDGVEIVIDTATGPSPDEREATEFFMASAGNLQEDGERAGVRRMVVVSIVGCDRFSAGYNVAKVRQEQAMLSGPVPVSILRATQFHEFVEQLMDWGTRGDVAMLPPMQTQLVAARSVAEVLAEMATGEVSRNGPISEVAGPRVENLADAARLLAERRGAPARVEEVDDPSNPDGELFANGGALPGPNARIAGPTFAEWLDR